ncbi:MAG: 16S rRNA (cytidine(1402)-2'-O)-methyltransferase [Sulfurimicrobium sp.]|nr:16S rRNA (cytidine(1402)-2'-O)-methyltransferase [Sulfurimicrobium sp.]MDP1705270.1 16S rRNA (cytidine(1402)-2'-O)-methyltransferase [Sulfurimicrobium sp.]MDP2199633.1 16S rRNA (cytidine(1402)-2'-O)-methyltransferase [Sulfurimicrobium sp.]
MHQGQGVNNVGTLYVVATPIGNLRDITLRALDVLKSADIVAAEDTRNTSHLLGHYGISAKLVALHEHNERVAAPKIIAALQEGKTVALVSDAGTPGISDPGAILVQAVREAGLPVTPLPGPNAAICALSAAGREDPHFLFYGFLPAKASARRKELEALRELPYIIAFYEAPHRIVETVEDALKVLDGERDITFARELTKLFESIHTCKLADAPAWLAGDPNRQRGEFVLLVSGAAVAAEEGISDDAQRILQLLLAELPLKQAVKLAAEISGEKKNALYDLALQLK